MRNISADIVYALRQFRLSPVFTATAILTLAIGIGGTTAIFSLMDAVMLKSLSVADPASLYRIGEGNDCCVEGFPQGDWGMFNFRLYQKLQNATPEFEELAAFKAGSAQFSVRRSGVERIARPLRGEYVTGNYFSAFGIRPLSAQDISSRRKLFNVAQWDPFALALAVVSLAVCALIAAVIPAVRAASIDPLKALRTE